MNENKHILHDADIVMVTENALIEGIQRAVDEISDKHGIVYDPNMPKAQVVACHYSSEANMIGAYYLFSEDLA